MWLVNRLEALRIKLVEVHAFACFDRRAVTQLVMLTLTLGLLAGREVRSDDAIALPSDGVLEKQVDESMLVKAIGGRRIWCDVNYFRGWRIQQNVLTKTYRLIDAKGDQLSTGTSEYCQTELNRIRDEQHLTEMSGPAVILIHGLMQSSKCMANMGLTLRDAGYSTIEFDYPSTQITIPDAAQYLRRMIESLEGIDEIHFVAHSMGGLVVRAYSGEDCDPRIKRLVMLGTPNRGAELADLTQKYWIVRSVSGPGARQLGTRADGLIPKLPIPNFEFAVVAGSRGTSDGWNPFIPGDDDGTVTVASTKLSGATDFSTVRTLHSRLLSNDEAIAQTVSFLKEGRLCPSRERQPIPTEETVNGQSPTPHRVPEPSLR